MDKSGLRYSNKTGGAYVDKTDLVKSVLDATRFVCPECGGPHESAEHGNAVAEHERLRSAVIEAAKAWSSVSSSTFPDSIKLDAKNTLHKAVDRLIEFEEHQT